MIGTKLGNYQIIDKLGEGGQGSVYKCLDARLGRAVAIKLLPDELTLNPKNLRYLEREARLASALDHPNICTIFDLGEEQGLHFIAMQLVEGKNLKDLAQGSPLELRSALSIAIQTTDALAAAHNQGIIHRDIKAMNIMVTSSGQVKVLDFGLAKLLDDNESMTAVGLHQTERTELGVPYGTPAYSAPEQARGDRVDARADIFSTGVVLFEMLTGVRPFGGTTSYEIRQSVINSTPRLLSELVKEEVPAQLQQILDRALAKNPNDRYQRVAEMRDELRDLLRRREGAAPFDAFELPPPVRLGPMARAMRWFKAASGGPGITTSRSPNTTTPETASTTVSDDRRKSLAILPFKNIGFDAETSFYEFSLADALITELARVRSLVVRPSSAIVKYQGGQTDPREAGRELSVDAVLSAGFLRAKDRFRVTAQLLDVASGEILWSDRIDASAADIIAVQDTITQRICDGLRLELSPDEQAGLQMAATADAGAYETYLRGRDRLGRYIYHTGAREDIDAAIEHFKETTALDPSFALGHGGLGAAYANRVMKGLGEKSDYSQAEEAFAKALSLDPHSLEPKVQMVFIHLSHGEKKKASTLADELRREFPNETSVHFVRSVLQRLDGDYARSMRSLDRMIRLNPAEGVVVSYNRARLLTYQGDYDGALAQLDAAGEPDHPLIRVFRAYALHYQGQPLLAVEILEQLFAQHPQLVGVRPIYAMSLFAVGRDADAKTQLTQAVRDIASSDHDVSYWLASAYALGGDHENAFYWLARAIMLGNENKAWFNADSNWTSLRDDERFTRLINSIGNPGLD